MNRQRTAPFGSGDGDATTTRTAGGPINRERIREAEQILQEYKRGKENLERRIIENERWYKMQHWSQFKSTNPGDPEPTSAWLFNSIANKHADAMDNFPAPSVLPREQGDEQDAEVLSEVLPVVLEQNNYEQTYSDMWWYKLKMGTGVTGIFWSAGKNNGLGEIDIRDVDLLNLFWEPGITDIQRSRHLFNVDMSDRDSLEAAYPQLKDAGAATTIDIAEYVYDDAVDTSKKAAVIDWYYKVNRGGREVLHYCKFCSSVVLYASENDPAYTERGFYDHGKYPFVFDALFPVAGSPAGFGYIDVCKSAQLYIDKLDQVILKYAVMAARPRFFVRQNGSINEQEYSDWSKDFVHYEGVGDPADSVMPITLPPLSETYINVRALKIEELKETSGNRDFSQGGTASGVTAASAIAALQEAGSKLSRDMIKSSYRAFSQVNYLCIELMRQFYQEARYFRVVGKMGEYKFTQFSGRDIAAKPQGHDFGFDMGYRVPVFDIKVASQKSSPFSTVAQNERAKELYGLGFFRPDLTDQALAALEMMQFEGIEAVRERISENGTMHQQLQQMQELVSAMAAQVDATSGTNFSPQIAEMAGAQAERAGMTEMSGVGRSDPRVNALGEALNVARSRTAGGARAKAAQNATPN